MMTAENSTGSSADLSRTWFGPVLQRATELLVAEDERLSGISFEIVQSDPELGIILDVRGDPSARAFLPAAPTVFKKFIRDAAYELGPNPDVKTILQGDLNWPLLAYQGRVGVEDDEGAEVVEIRSSSPPAVETRVDTRRRADRLDHPSYYNLGNIEVWDATDEWGLGKGFNRGSAIKYIARAGEKPGSDELEDLEKARQFLDHEIERMIRERSKG